MATTDCCSLLFKDKKQNDFVITDAGNDQYKNLNLNQKFQKSTNSFSESSKSTSFQKKKPLDYDFVKNERDSNSLKKSAKDLSDFGNQDYENEDGLKKKWKNHPNPINSSSLLLHIEAYGKMAKVSSDFIDATKENAEDGKNAKQIFDLSPSFQKPFEFPRQQKNGETKVPEVLHYKASQNLHDPNQMDHSGQASQQPLPSNMASKAELMEKKLKEKLETDIVQIRDLSDGCGDKFDVVCASAKFKDLGTLPRNRLMHKILEDEFKHAHALTLHTFSMDEYEKAVECQLPMKRVLDEMKEI